MPLIDCGACCAGGSLEIMNRANRTDMFTADERDFMHEHISEYLSLVSVCGHLVTAWGVTVNHM